MAERPPQNALAEFVAEAQETIEALDSGLSRLEQSSQGEPDPEVLNAVFRAAHSLKGLAVMFGVDRMAGLAHALEDRLDDVRMGRQALDGPTLDLLLAAPEILTRIAAEEAAQRPPQTADAAAALAERLRQQPAAEDAPGRDPLAALDLDEKTLQVLTEYEEHRLRANVQRGARLWRVGAAFDLATFDTGLEALKARLRPHGEVVCALPSSDPADPGAIAFDVLLASTAGGDLIRAAAAPAAAAEVARRGTAPERAHPSAASPPAPVPPPARPAPPAARAVPSPSAPPAAAPAPDSLPPPPAVAPLVRAEPDPSLRSPSQMVRVDIGKLDRLMNVVGEIVLVKDGVARLAERLRAGDEVARLGLELSRQARALDRRLAELQSGVLEVRMVPLGQIFEKLARMVRKMARELGKEVDFQVEGSEVELDKLIVEELSDPLMHLIRNALDHGVEAPEGRRAAGKPPAARLRLAAAQKGSRVVIAVEDDGAGLDERRIREVAVTRGLVTAEAAAELGRADALNLIFLPGFSTAREVTALSGRGVGMDVVRNNIGKLSGIIDLHTERGRGTRFEITLPVTLAIVRALVVGVSGRTYAVPLNSVLEILEVRPAEVRTIETREVVTLRGATVPLLRLGRHFGLEPPSSPGPLYVVVVGLAQRRLGIAVDALQGQNDVVVKPLGRTLAGVRGIAGATDLGGRRTVLVLDVGAIIGEVLAEERPVEAAG